MLNRLWPFIVFDGSEPAGAPAEPAAVEPPAEPAAVEPPAEPAAGPWAADLAVYFEDESVRGQADKFLREKIQPHVTKLEQTQSEYKPAHEFFDDLRDDPIGTTLALAEEVYGAEIADKIAELVAAGEDPATAAKEATEGESPKTDEDPVIAKMKAEYEAQERSKLWDQELARIKSTPEAQGVDIDPELFAVFVHQAEGDMDAALPAYKAFEERSRTKYGQPAPAPPAPPAPLGTQPGDAPASTPPIAPKITSFDEALDATLAEIRSNRNGPTPVGTV
jgi:hypothetical protein